MEKVIYLSEAWRTEVEKQLKANLSKEKMNGVTSSMTNILKNCKDGQERYFYVAFTEGEVSSVQTGVGEGPKAEFLIIGDYETFAKISQAELGAQKALMSGELKLKGNMVKALKLASLVDRLNKIIATIPTDYEA